MNILKLFGLGLAAMSLGACASITKGTDQTIVINSNPSGADCSLNRAGVQIAQVNPTPGQVTVDKSKDDIVIDCALEGHKPAKHVAASQAEAMTAGNLVFGGLVGLAIDASSGAINKYPSNVMVVMQRGDGPFSPAPAAAPQAGAVEPTRVAVVPEKKPQKKVAKTAGQRSRPQPKPEDMTATERMDLQAGPGYRNYPRKTSGYY